MKFVLPMYHIHGLDTYIYQQYRSHTLIFHMFDLANLTQPDTNLTIYPGLGPALGVHWTVAPTYLHEYISRTAQIQRFGDRVKAATVK